MDELTKLALVGTAKHPGLPIDRAHPAEQILPCSTEGSPESRFLLRAGVHAVYEQAGSLATEIAPMEPAPDGEAPLLSARLVRLLRNALFSDSRETLSEFAGVLQAGRLRFPAELLPEALNVTDPDLRQRLRPVLGPRAQWLSRFNEAWSWVAAGAGQLAEGEIQALEETWDEGHVGRRSEALRRVRQADPERGRQWLEGSFDGEKADHRRRLLEQLAAGLSLRDEPFLENALSDRSAGVRQAAAQLLTRMPQSRLSARMLERGREILRGEGEGEGDADGKGKLRLSCHPPETLEKDWIHDGIPEKPPAGRGRRAFWVETLLSAIPPRFWTEAFKADPRTLIASIRRDTFAPAVILGWTRAALAFEQGDPHSQAWLQPLWEHWSEVPDGAGKGGEEAAELLWELFARLPRETAERNALRLIKRFSDPTALPFERLFLTLPSPWSVPFAREYLALTRRLLKTRDDVDVDRWASSLLPASRSLPPECFEEALKPWELKPKRSPTWTQNAIEKRLHQFGDVLRTRQTFYAEVRESGPVAAH